MENQKTANDIFCSHDNRAIVMANNEAFGALDFQHDDTQLDANIEPPQQLLTAFSNKTRTQPPLDIQNWPSNSQKNDGSSNDIPPSNTFPNAQTFDGIRDTQLESDVEDRPHTGTEPQLLQQRDNALTVDPAPESSYNFRNRNRLNPYTFSGKVSVKWVAAPRRTRRRACSIDQKT
jgi:hypothetical protein